MYHLMRIPEKLNKQILKEMKLCELDDTVGDIWICN